MDQPESLLQFENEIQKHWMRCKGCGLCARNCPVAPEGVSVAMLNFAATSRSELEEKSLAYAKACIGCGHCSRNCPSGVRRDLLMLAVKRRAPKSKGFDSFAKQIQKEKTAKRTEKEIRLGVDSIWLNRMPESSAPLLIYLGCCVKQAPKPFAAIIKIAKALNSDYTVLGGGLFCCGQRHRLSGDFEAAEALEKDLAQAISKINPQRVITGCGHCLEVLRGISKKSKDSSFEAMSFEGWLWKNRKRFTFQETKGTLCYQPSCEKRRAPEVGTQKLLALTAEKVQSLSKDPERFDCCGGFGFDNDPGIFLPHHTRALSEAKEAGADAFVLDCAQCLTPYAKSAAKSDLETISVVEWVLDRMEKDNKEGES